MQTVLARESVTVMRPLGRLDAATVQEFHHQLNAVLQTPNFSALLIDLEQVDFMDSAGLMALLSTLKRVQALNKQFGVCAACPAIRMIFELSQLDRVFEIYENATAFKAAIANP